MPSNVANPTASGPPPKSSTDNMVIIALKATLTRLLPSSIVDSSLSMLAIISETLFAPGTLVLTRCESRVFWKERNAASELEKNADKTRKTTMSST